MLGFETGDVRLPLVNMSEKNKEILKKAMIEIYNEFNKLNLKSKMLIQVHDELVFNVLENEKEKVIQIVTYIMENTYKLNVPLKVEINTGKDWYDAK